jgi:hypothetical protein
MGQEICLPIDGKDIGVFLIVIGGGLIFKLLIMLCLAILFFKGLHQVY